MSIISGLFRSRDKPTNSTSGSAYRFFFGGSNANKAAVLEEGMKYTPISISPNEASEKRD